MAASLIFGDAHFPHLSGDLQQNQKRTLNYLVMLKEDLSHILRNLDETNFNEAALNNIKEPIYARIKNTEKGLETQLALTAAGLGLRIDNAEGQISSLAATATSLTVQMADANGNISALQQTVDGFTLAVSNGESSSRIQLKSGGVVISSQTIFFSGTVLYSDLEEPNSWTSIDGGNIKTGTIEAIDMYGCTFNALASDRNTGFFLIDDINYSSDRIVGSIYRGSSWGSSNKAMFIATDYSTNLKLVSAGELSLNAEWGMYLTCGTQSTLELYAPRGEIRLGGHRLYWNGQEIDTANLPYL